jgi:hypothetical protein
MRQNILYLSLLLGSIFATLTITALPTLLSTPQPLSSRQDLALVDPIQ